MRQWKRTWNALVALTACALVAGPQWCCCTLQALEPETSAEAPAQVPADGGCCCCRTLTDAPSSCPRDEGGHEGDGTCPCREKSRPLASLGGIVAVGDLGHASEVFWQDAIPVGCGPLAQPAIARSGGGRWPARGKTPVLAGRALLRAMSTLRC